MINKIIITIFFGLLFVLSPVIFQHSVYAQGFVSVVNPIRGGEFWEDLEQQPISVVQEQIKVLQTTRLPVTWLLRFDTFQDALLKEQLQKSNLNQELGLLLEITPQLTSVAQVPYHQSPSWHNAGSVFLTGYSVADRQKIIDTAFENFKTHFGGYPHSVGAWWLDASSLEYMQKKYDIRSALIVADQYSTDSYQIWGQYWGTPYYPSKVNALFPAQNKDNKIPVVMMQWANRDPFNGYGKGVEESTYSVQANDYIDYHHLGIDYFNRLIEVYTQQPYNSFGSVVVGLENTYSWKKYGAEYTKQLQSLAQMQTNGKISVVTMNDFSQWYIPHFPDVSPTHIIVATDPLAPKQANSKQVVWFMNPYYRASWFYNNEGSVFRDIRQYSDGEKEICHEKACTELNFATFALRVLDDVTHHQRKVVDMGAISNVKFNQNAEKFTIEYQNASGIKRLIGFLPRDIQIDQKIWSIDSFILEAIKTSPTGPVVDTSAKGLLQSSLWGQLKSLLLFMIFLLLAIIMPGLVLTERIFQRQAEITDRLFSSVIVGLVGFVLASFITGMMGFAWGVWVYLLSVNLYFLSGRRYRLMHFEQFHLKLSWPVIVTCMGSLFMWLPSFKNGLLYDFGIGFWGPNGHDGVWHVALVEQLLKGLPPVSPIIAGTPLHNYHYFYDLLVANTHYISHAEVIDLVFRWYPLLFGVLLGWGTIRLLHSLRISSLGITISLLMVYFSGSFGWMVEYLNQGRFGGESAFWVNQPISANLNPPFFISLILIIGIVHFLITAYHRSWNFYIILSLLLGSLLVFKAYAAIILLPAIGVIGLIDLFRYRNPNILIALGGAVVLTLILLLPSYQISNLFSQGSGLFIWQPWWFIHTMIDSPDRVGWTRLSIMRMTAIEQNNYVKFFLSEGVGLLLFFLGNLGLRSVGMALLFNKKNWWNNHLIVLMVVMVFISMIIPLFFIQRGTAWNVIQFFYYALYFWALAAGISLASVWQKWPKVLASMVIIICLAIGPINAWSTARGYLSPLPAAKISNEELVALRFLKEQPEGIILTYPYQKNLKQQIAEPWPLLVYETTSYVSAFSAHPSFMEDQIQQEILADPLENQQVSVYQQRLIDSTEFFRSQNTEWSNDFLRKSMIGYVYLPKIYRVVLPPLANLEQIFDNQEVTILKVKDSHGS